MMKKQFKIKKPLEFWTARKLYNLFNPITIARTL